MVDDGMGPMSPLPSTDALALSRNVSRLNSSVTRMEGKVDTIKDDILPKVMADVREARDGVLNLRIRVKNLESLPPPPHDCYEQDRQKNQDDDIGALQTSLAQVGTSSQGLGKLVWWLLGMVVVVGGTAVSFAIASRVSVAENTTLIQAQRGDLSRHEHTIETLERSRQADREQILKEVRLLPNKVEKATQRRDPTIDEFENASLEMPLTNREKEVLLKILSKVRDRGQQQVLSEVP
jgi:hypothetical protein